MKDSELAQISELISCATSKMDEFERRKFQELDSYEKDKLMFARRLLALAKIEIEEMR